MIKIGTNRLLYPIRERDRQPTAPSRPIAKPIITLSKKILSFVFIGVVFSFKFSKKPKTDIIISMLPPIISEKLDNKPYKLAPNKLPKMQSKNTENEIPKRNLKFLVVLTDIESPQKNESKLTDNAVVNKIIVFILYSVVYLTLYVKNQKFDKKVKYSI